jgi:hypothetical protein
MMHDECMVGIALHWSKAVRGVPDGAQLHPTVYKRLAMASVRISPLSVHIGPSHFSVIAKNFFRSDGWRWHHRRCCWCAINPC